MHVEHRQSNVHPLAHSLQKTRYGGHCSAHFPEDHGSRFIKYDTNRKLQQGEKPNLIPYQKLNTQFV